MGETGQQVDLCDHAAANANAACSLQDALAQLGKDALLDFNGSLMRGEHADLVLLQLWSSEALSIGQRLLALIIRRHQGQIGPGYLNRITEDVVKAHL